MRAQKQYYSQDEVKINCISFIVSSHHNFVHNSKEISVTGHCAIYETRRVVREAVTSPLQHRLLE